MPKSVFPSCANCGTRMDKTRGGRSKIVKTPEEATKFTVYHGKQISPNDVLCARCRIVRARVLEKRTESGGHTSDVALGAAGGHSSHEEQDSPEYLPSSDDSSSDDDDIETIRLSQNRVEVKIASTVSTHNRCLCCPETTGLKIIDFNQRHRAFSEAQIYIPQGARTCSRHRLENTERLADLPIFSDYSFIEFDEMKRLLQIPSEKTLSEKVRDLELSEDQYRNLAGFSHDQFLQILRDLRSLKASASWNAAQALFIFLFKLRTGNSYEIVASLLDLSSARSASRAFANVRRAFERDILPTFGPKFLTRQILLDNTTMAARRLLGLAEDQLTLVLDGTYIRHQKSSNNTYQRQSFSGQKKTHLCKPFTICTTNGFIVDFSGPYLGTWNDARIVQEVLQNHDLRKLLKENDVLIVDRGFRDAVNYMEGLGFKVAMPALKGNRKQLPTEEANASRRVTKLRWIVEAVHGRVAQRFKMLHHTLDNRMLPKVRSLCQIVACLENRYGERSWGDNFMASEIIEYMERRTHERNTLGEEVESGRWKTRNSLLQPIQASDLIEFPALTMQDLHLFTSGPYQINLARSYLAEAMTAENNVLLRFVKEAPSIIRMEIPSRHCGASNRKT